MADTKISALTAATDLVSATVPIVQGGANKKADISLFATLTLLATINTTSGSSQSGTWTGASYRRIYCEVEGVVFGNTTAHLRVALSSNGGSSYGTAVQCAASKTAAGDAHHGWLEIGDVTSTSSAIRVANSMIDNANTITLATTKFVVSTTSAAEINGVQFSPSTNTFSAGVIRVYGIK